MNLRHRLAAFGATLTLAAVPLTLVAPTAQAAGCPPVAAHRGLAYEGSGTENGERTFLAAYKIDGVDWAETDLWFTTDHKGVMFHDNTLERVSNGDGLVIEKSSTQIAALRLDDGEQILTLVRLLALVRADPNAHLFLELKRYLTPTEQAVLEPQLVGLEGRVYLTGFRWELASMQRMKANNPKLNISLNVDAPLLPMPAGISGENFTSASQMTPEAVKAIHAAGGVVRTGGETLTSWKAGIAAGADMIVTGHPYAYQRARWNGDLGC